MHLTPLQKRIVEILADGSWHCLASEEYQKDDRARISELRRKGFVFDESGKICDRHNHQSKLKLRRLISFPNNFMETEQRVKEWADRFVKSKPSEFELPPMLF